MERPLPPVELDAGFVAEYRAMHEDIFRRWREESKAGAEWVARRGAEELALWYAGGITLRGLGWLGGKVAPTVVRALMRGGAQATSWLRTTLTRLSAEERLAFERLWTKVQLEGKGSLITAERTELRELMVGIERLIQEPLDRETKIKLRAKARQAYKTLHPELAELLEQRGALLPIHHRCPLEYAHLFPEKDINAAENLAMVTQNVHKRIDALWTRFRQASEPGHVPYSLKEAEEGALARLQRLFPGLE
ncbi:hypothetical protein [Hyalangium gracile]|uniref:hypothetical protein n=1 Tax=Hyalangium gracile TaxID=394092 RepID=UPI001CCF072D|nr:hypothetical protein [Hyalangium gracile]